MNEKTIMETENRYLANVFSKKPIVLAKGRGALLWDITGKEYDPKIIKTYLFVSGLARNNARSVEERTQLVEVYL